jgi:hypothetical protein
MVRQRTTRRDDVKKACEDAMQELGYNVTDVMPSSLEGKSDGKACAVTYGDFHSDPQTTQTYLLEIPIEIEFNIQNDNEVPFEIMRVQAFVTWYVKADHCAACRSFYFTNISAQRLHDAHHVVMTGTWRVELNWMLNNMDWCPEGDITQADINSALAAAKIAWCEAC